MKHRRIGTHANKEKAINSAIAETARVKITSLTAVNQLTLTVTLNMTANFISLKQLSIRGILYPVMLCQLAR